MADTRWRHLFFKQKLWPRRLLLRLQYKVLRGERPRQIYFHRISYDGLWFLEHRFLFQDSTIAHCYHDLKKKLREIDFERKNSLNQCNTVWKWGNFSVTRILREINFCRCVESQNLLFWVVLAPVNFGSGEFLHFVRAEVYSKLISSKIFMAEKMSICNTVQSVEIAEIYSHLTHF